MACILFAVIDQVSYREQMAEQVLTLAAVIGTNSTAAITFGDQETATRIMGALANEPNVECAVLYGTDGVEFAGYGDYDPGRCKCPDGVDAEGYHFARGRLVAAQPVNFDGQRIGTVVVYRNMSALWQRLARFALLVVVVLLASVATAFLTGVALQVSVSKRLLALVDTTERISQCRDYSMRAAVQGTDEIGTLVRGFNDMLDQIQKRDKTLLEDQDSLRSLADRLLLKGEQERRRIAVGIHDSICQDLWGAMLSAKQLARSDDGPAVRRGLIQLGEVLQNSMKEARTLTFELSPPSLYDLGLGAALVYLAEEMKRLHGMTVHIEGSETELETTDDLNIILYRSVRELLVNVHKYAGTAEAIVQLEREDGLVRIRVSDNGKGFDVETPGNRQVQRFGLFSIREHIRALNGRLEISSAPGQGTDIAIEVPFA